MYESQSTHPLQLVFFCKYEQSIKIIFKTLEENVAYTHYQHASLKARALYK